MRLWQSRQMSVGKSSGSSTPQILQDRTIGFHLMSFLAIIISDVHFFNASLG